MAHVTDRCLIGKKVAAIDSIVEMLIRRIAFAGWLHTTIDTTLGTNGVGPSYRNEGKEVYLTTSLGNFYCRHEARKPSPYDNNPVVHAELLTVKNKTFNPTSTEIQGWMK
jgi:hypothetical protein